VFVKYSVEPFSLEHAQICVGVVTVDPAYWIAGEDAQDWSPPAAADGHTYLFWQ